MCVLWRWLLSRLRGKLFLSREGQIAKAESMPFLTTYGNVFNLQLSKFCGEFTSFSEFYEGFVIEEMMSGMFFAPHVSETVRRRIDKRFVLLAIQEPSPSVIWGMLQVVHCSKDFKISASNEYSKLNC